MDEKKPLRRTKILATLGPASASKEVLSGLLRSGVNLIRLNFSHGDDSSHLAALSLVRETAGELKLPVGIIADLQGPRIRTGLLKEKSVTLIPGKKITITTAKDDDFRGDELIITTTYKGLAEDVSPDNRILIDDGLIELKVLNVEETEVECEIIYGGTLSEHKGVNIPGVKLSIAALGKKDLSDLQIAINGGVDYIAISFVQSAGDITHLKELISEAGSRIPVIAKIETMKAVDELEAIVRESDALMIARGDLGVELSPEKVPILQKKIIEMANEAGKPVITATQMLESMIKNPRPTRAEASDVANAVFDGTDAVMLSGETAVGLHPVRSVETMVKIILETELQSIERRRFIRRNLDRVSSFEEAVSFAAFAAAGEVRAKAICVFTETGSTALKLARLRPITPLVAFTPSKETLQALTLGWGISPYLIEFGDHTDEMICRGEAELLNLGLAELKDTIVIVSGTKVGMMGATNMMKVDWIGSDECKPFIK
jgi:pyruvate kinase